MTKGNTYKKVCGYAKKSERKNGGRYAKLARKEIKKGNV